MSGKKDHDITKDELYVSQKKYYSQTYQASDSTPWETAFDI
jgi:hypothetical protein